MQLEFSDIIIGLSFAGSLATVLLSTRFVSKQDYKEDKETNEKFKVDVYEKLNKLNLEIALRSQPVTEMANSLKRIEESLGKFIENHQELERRVFVIEQERNGKP